MSNDPTSSYQLASACGATPVGQVIALYDTVLRDFGRAMAALQAKDVETRVFELNHAMVVIGYLQYVLDFERGGEPAKHFSQFYNSARALVLQANFKAAPGPIEELIAMFSEVRQAWYQAEQLALPVRNEAPAADRAGANAAAETSPSDDGANKSQLQWSA